MAVIDLPGRQIQLRVVYYGPAFGGKTTSLQFIAARVPEHARGDFVSISSGDERTLFLDDLPLSLGAVAGWTIHADLVSVPGQPDFERTRVAILGGADGVVFVADSDPARTDANCASLEELRRNLVDAGRDPESFPLVFQFNKRDLPAALPTPDLHAALNPLAKPAFPTVATQGDGVFDALRAVCRQVARAL
ncbi:MAG: gliding-motility protein MglA [Thermomicrobiales bacterium]|nr:gliding-motility protein MglA [Thermomicrobiales bacterium]